MSVILNAAVWPRRAGEDEPRRLFLDVVRALPPQDTRLEVLERRPLAESWRTSDACLTCRLPPPEHGAEYGISAAQLGPLDEITSQQPFADWAWVVNGHRRWESQPLDDQSSFPIELIWPDFESGACASLWLGKNCDYVGDVYKILNLGYVVRLFSALGDSGACAHAVAEVGYTEVAPCNCFAIWHRELRDFAVDMLWTLAQSLGAVWYMDRAVTRSKDVVAALVARIREKLAAGTAISQWERYGPAVYRDAEQYASPRLHRAVIEQLLDNLDQVADGVIDMDEDTVLYEFERGGASYVGHATRTGGCLWTKLDILDCVDGFYVTLAKRLLPSLTIGE